MLSLADLFPRLTGHTVSLVTPSHWSLCPQLAGNVHNDVIGGFPGERWAQTANYGYSPNPALPNTFMAVAMDLPDFNSPYGT